MRNRPIRLAKALAGFAVLHLLTLLFFTSFLLAGPLSKAQLQKLSPDARFLLHTARRRPASLAKALGVAFRPAEEQFDIFFKVKAGAGAVQVAGVKVGSRFGRVFTARCTREGLEALATTPEVEWIELSERLSAELDLSAPEIGAEALHYGNPVYRGNTVIVGIFDSGIDWSHEDFVDQLGHSRILYLWDMTDSAGPPPSGFDYGTEYTRTQLDDEIDGVPTGLVRERDTDGHGTHVAGIAAGNGHATGNGEPSGQYVGIALQANLIVVKGGNGSYSSTDEINGMKYIFQRAAELGRPAVVNFSLGGQKGPHDGTKLQEQAIDAAVGPGKLVAVSAGNEGDESIHASGYVQQGGTVTTELRVEDDENYVWVDIWFSGADVMSISITSPSGYTTPWVRCGTQEDWIHWDTDDGRIELIAPSRNPENQDYEFEIYLDDEGGTAVSGGDWSFTLQGLSIQNGRFDAWTKEDAAAFTSNLDFSVLVGSPGTARGAITVASYCTKNRWTSVNGHRYSFASEPTVGDISPFSSPGPTRDGREKPEIAAPGQGIVSSLSSDSNPRESRIVEDGVHLILSGTSMAAPHVTGAIALLLEKNPDLTPDEARTILAATARTDEYTGSVWNKYWGYGKLAVDRAIDYVEGSIAGSSGWHDVGLVSCAISDWGAVASGSGDSPGFAFPSWSEDDNADGGSLLVTAGPEDVADSYGDLEDSEDDTWRTTTTGALRMVTPGPVADQEGFAQFEKRIITPDGLAHIVVDQHSYA
ncbi:MAG TPA: hypothetical protein ENJ23_04455, partial [Bacteroidetes bacterium]|nr:hypothetical protein [Bacteroidota bacterium]